MNHRGKTLCKEVTFGLIWRQMGVLQLGVWVWGWVCITFQAIWTNTNKDVEARESLATCGRTKELCGWAVEHPGDIGWTCHVLETRFWIVSHWRFLWENSLSIFVVQELPADGVWDKVIMAGWMWRVGEDSKLHFRAAPLAELYGQKL